MEYLKSIYPYFKANIKVSRLGTIDYGYKNLDLEDKVFRIISCSWVVPVKRVDKIIEALAQISDLKLEWTHLGGGPILEEIKEKSRLLLNNKVIYKFPGSLTNQQIIKFYQENNFNLFINVSDSEGIPVSIMEAMSFGIPVIATDVGGVNEVVQDGHTGLLLNQNFSINELITKILFVAKMSSADYHTMRIKSRKLWEDKYNSKKNYSDFFNSVNDE
jgi:glycosyltransferase involved in cell wall biosynthesis